MFIPFVMFSSLLCLLFFGNRSKNKTREKQYEYLIENIKNEVELYVEQTRSFSITIGMNNNDLRFNHCDLYLLKNAIIILGFTKNSFFRQLSRPIILTDELNQFSNRFQFAYIKKPNKISFQNNIVKIYFGEKGITKTDVILKLLSLQENEINKFKELVGENKWIMI